MNWKFDSTSLPGSVVDDSGRLFGRQHRLEHSAKFGDTLTISETLATRGPKFGPDFNPDDLELIDRGTMEFNLSCTGVMDYNGSQAGCLAAPDPIVCAGMLVV